jgi:UDP-N-acetylglucosamine--N-acetylmuramyl-(pentapeptide) pyrophosphoryl-undecaprenol N-acetylglucosamine transferase
LKKETQDTNNKAILCYVAGGSGGHILPALTLASKQRQCFPNKEILFFTTRKKIDSRVIEGYPWISQLITFSHSTSNKHPLKLLYFCFNGFKIFFVSLWYFIYLKPERIVTTGGFLALPVCYAAKALDIPIDLYEVNSVPGRAASLIGRWAENTYITFQSCRRFFNKRCILVKYPLRFEEKDKVVNKQDVITSINSELENQELLFSSERKTILIIGGSQGALYINNLFKEWLKNHSNSVNIQVIHQVGFADRTDWKALYSYYKISSIVFSYRENIHLFYGLADIVISRGGAGMLFELEFFQKKCIIIPFDFGRSETRHQVNSACEMAKKNPEIFIVQRQQELDMGAGVLNSNLLKLLV